MSQLKYNKNIDKKKVQPDDPVVESTLKNLPDPKSSDLNYRTLYHDVRSIAF